MQATSKTVTETLVAIDAVRVPANRMRGLKPAALRFCFESGLIKDYAGHGVLLSPAGVEAVKAVCPDWVSVARTEALNSGDAK